MTRFYLPLFLSIGALGQHVGFGVKGGFTATPDAVTGFPAADESKRYIVGPMVEVTLPLRLGIEVNALYSRLGYHSGFSNFAIQSDFGARANSWEFPILLKYRLRSSIVHPYVSGGIAPRYTSGTVRGVSSYFDIGTGIHYGPSPFTQKWGPAGSYGGVIGGGVEFGLGRLKIAPEARYTHWNEDIINGNGSQGFIINATQNQVRILLGLSWR